MSFGLSSWDCEVDFCCDAGWSDGGFEGWCKGLDGAGGCVGLDGADDAG